MNEKMITKEQAEMLLKATYSFFKLSREYESLFPNEEHNAFRWHFAGMRQAVELIGLSDEYLRYAAEQEESND